MLPALYEGRCKCDNPCNCPMYHDLVCGSDGYTWPNTCLLNCAKTHAAGEYESRKNLTVTSTGGPCGHRCNCEDEDVDLVCGSNGVTYKNKCVLDCIIDMSKHPIFKLTMEHYGACERLNRHGEDALLCNYLSSKALSAHYGRNIIMIGIFSTTIFCKKMFSSMWTRLAL